MENIGEYIDPQYLPDGKALGEPSRMTESDAHRLIAHWNERQKHNGEDVFRFARWSGDGGKTKLEAVYRSAIIETPGNPSAESKKTNRRKARPRRKNPKRDRKGKARATGSETNDEEDGEEIDIPTFSEVEEDDEVAGGMEAEEDSAEKEQEIHPDSPAAVASTREARVEFLASLIPDRQFQMLVMHYESLPVKLWFC